MTEVLHSSPSSSSPTSSLSCAPSSTPNHHDSLFLAHSYVDEVDGDSRVSRHHEIKERDKQRDQLSLLALLVTLFRKSFRVSCKTGREELCGMEIGWPTNVCHVAHVTFDRFNGFLGLPVEFEPEVPRRVPSASATVFGVSTESMQLSYDHRGNSVPTILLLMQRRLYAQGGLQAEGIFRINAENSQEEYVRDQLNSGVVPEGIDVHCLAGLIKAWFRELPSGILDLLSPEDVIQCQSEEDCTTLVRTLSPTEAALLDWAINLMADVVQQEHVNKMNAHNIAMVFAPNMTQMADPYTALMYAVQVMNFLKTLILKVVREREDSLVEPAPVSQLEPPSDGSGRGSSPPQGHVVDSEDENDEMKPVFIAEEPNHGSSSGSELDNQSDDAGEAHGSSCSVSSDDDYFEDCEALTSQIDAVISESETRIINSSMMSSGGCSGTGKSSIVPDITSSVPAETGNQPAEKSSKAVSNLSRINSVTETSEAWW